MAEKILILDFGSQYTQLIARAVREANVYCEIVPFHKKIEFDDSLKGIILSGSPFSVNDANAPVVDVRDLNAHVPVLGICYGAQLTAKQFGGSVANSSKREYGRALLHKEHDDILLNEVTELSQVWMSHADTILNCRKVLMYWLQRKIFLMPHLKEVSMHFRYIACNFIPKFIIPSKEKKY